MERAYLNKIIRKIDGLKNTVITYDNVYPTNVNGVYDTYGTIKFKAPPIFANYQEVGPGLGIYGFAAIIGDDGRIFIIGGSSSLDNAFENARSDVLIYDDLGFENFESEVLPKELFKPEVYMVGGKLVVVGGIDKFGEYNTDIIRREENGNWEIIETTGYVPAAGGAYYRSLDGYLYCVGGVGNDAVQRTSDGVTWETVGVIPEKIYGASIVQLGGVYYLISGYTEDGGVNSSVYSSTDLVNFTFEGSTGFYEIREGTTFIEHGGYVYALGGILFGQEYSGSVYKTDNLFGWENIGQFEGGFTDITILKSGPDEYFILGGRSWDWMLNMYITNYVENENLTGTYDIYIRQDYRFINHRVNKFRALIKKLGDAEATADVYIDGNLAAEDVDIEEFYLGDILVMEFGEILVRVKLSRDNTDDDIIIMNNKVYYTM